VTRTSTKLTVLLNQARLSRRPLELHRHKPLAIKTSIPKFEESFNPDKHYDPDSKLKAEHKRERKGAMRELRKDANFIARESLKEKKERDAAYEKKYKRLIAEIQGEEGRESKQYEREKEHRKKSKK
jgi:nucleolar protein 14